MDGRDKNDVHQRCGTSQKIATRPVFSGCNFPLVNVLAATRRRSRRGRGKKMVPRVDRRVPFCFVKPADVSVTTEIRATENEGERARQHAEHYTFMAARDYVSTRQIYTLCMAAIDFPGEMQKRPLSPVGNMQRRSNGVRGNRR